MPRPIDLTGEVFGWLTAIECVEKGKGRNRVWKLQCCCGKFVCRSTSVLAISRRKKSLSTCGCFVNTKPPTIHGGYRTPEWESYASMIARCERPRCNGYKNYGGRGIKICQRWRESFSNFLEDMGKKPSPKHSLDRIDVNGNYEPSNCRWASREMQSINKRQKNNRLVGAVWHKRHNRWMSTFRNKFIGYFNSAEDAHTAYMKEREKYIQSISS